MFRIRMTQLAIVAAASVGGTIVWLAVCVFLDLL
jgi:hypothetical protein